MCPPTSCRSSAGTTSSSGSATRSRRRTSTSTRSASRASAYAGPETGVRDRASYVLEQGDVRFVFTSALREEHEIARHAGRHGDGVSDIALTVPDATRGVPRGGAARRPRRRRAALASRTSSARVELSAIATYGDTLHTFVNRGDYGGPFMPGYARARRTATERGRRPDARSTTSSATSSSAG